MYRPTEQTYLQARQWAKERIEDSQQRGLNDSRGYRKKTPAEELAFQTETILAEQATKKALEQVGYSVNYSFAVGQFKKPDLFLDYGGEQRRVQVKLSNNRGGVSIPASHMNVDFVVAVSGSAKAGYEVCGALSPHQITGHAGLGFSTDWGNGRAMVTGCRHDTFKNYDLLFRGEGL